MSRGCHAVPSVRWSIGVSTAIDDSRPEGADVVSQVSSFGRNHDVGLERFTVIVTVMVWGHRRVH